ncbi:MAG: nickel-dependent lactate racemase [Planctomycetota bacterium]|nr:nickel-dependent lactate racemase [Planctomycetota bacterium]
MRSPQTVDLRFGKGRLQLQVPATADILCGPAIPALDNPQRAVEEALTNPIQSESLAAIARRKQPRSVVITMSDITRPVPNELLITAILEQLNKAGVPDAACTILIATGMHRPSTPAERQIMLGSDLIARCQIVDHKADQPQTLVRISDAPPISINRLYNDAEMRIVTGLIEPHFMAGYSGGRKGICPGLVDLETVQRFHGYQTMGHAQSVEGVLSGNPCHEIAMAVARQVPCDFLVNAAITNDRAPAGIYAGDLFAAHEQGCQDVERWTTAAVDAPYDLVVQSAGGQPLDESFYQTVKGMVQALPALHDQSTLLMCSACTEVGSPAYVDLMQRHGRDFRNFLAEIANTATTAKDQWEFQMQTRVLERIGVERLVLVNDGLARDLQAGLAVTPAPGEGPAASRAQALIDAFVEQSPDGRIAVIPEGPYTMLKARQALA